MSKWQKEITSWSLYQFASNGFSTVIITTLLPIYFSKVAASPLSHVQSTAYWGYVNGISLFLAAILSPLVGAIANRFCIRKKLLLIFTFVGVVLTGSLFFMTSGFWYLTLWIFCLSNLAYTLGDMLHDGFLPHLAGKIDHTSSKAYALGYLGGGLLLAIDLGIITLMSDKELAVRISFLTVSVWWALFTLPLLFFVNEPVVKVSFTSTLRHIKEHPEAALFLLAFWVYNDGIGTIIKMAAIYGSDVGIGQSTLVGAILMTQFVGIPFSIAFGHLAQKIGAKRCIYLGLLVYTLISIGAYFMTKPIHFWILAFTVGTVQGGTQALSRSFFGRLIPLDKTAEFFGFYSLSSKTGGIIGPLVFAMITQATGSSRYSVVSLIVFFTLGAYLLSLVKKE